VAARIASNHVKRWRHRRRLVALPEDESDDGRKMAVRDDPLADLARQRQEAALSRALLGLPAKYRTAIVLCDLQQLSYADAARALGCAVGTVRSRLHRGRARLARMLRRTSGDLMCGTPAAKLFSDLYMPADGSFLRAASYGRGVWEIALH
jgi:RNA polymerase sigma-70 factor (ECF subfamily)